MRNLLMTLVLCGLAHLASASTGCPATVVAQPDTPPAAELISSAAAQSRVGTTAAQRVPMMVPASVHASGTQVMGGPPNDAVNESPRHGSPVVMVLAAVGVMLVMVLRRIGATD